MSANWFLGRSAWRGRWLGLIGLGLLAGIVGGVVMASIGGIRRSSTALDRLIDESNFPSIEIGSQQSYEVSQRYAEAIDDLADVERVVLAERFIGREAEEKNWWSIRAFGAGDPSTPVIVSGRAADPDRVDEVIVSVNTARIFGLAVGETFTLDIYARAQMRKIGEDTWTEPTGAHPELEVVGVYRDPLDAARSGTGTSILGTRAFVEEYSEQAGLASLMVVPRPGADLQRLTDAVAEVNDRFGREADGFAPPDQWLEAARDAEQQSQGVILIGLGAFAAVAVAAGVVAHGQSLRRWLYRVEGEQRAQSAMGATRADRRVVVMLATAPHVLIAVPVAVVISFLLSPLFPFGVLADVEPATGLRADGPLLALGGLTVAVVLLFLTALVSDAVVRGRRQRRQTTRALAGVSSAERAGAPVAATVGIRFALRPGTARLALPVTTAMAAAVFAVAGVVAAGVFTTSLDRLVAEPARYGNQWDLSLELLSSSEGEAALAELEADPEIASIGRPTTINPVTTVDGQLVTPTILDTEKGSLMLQLLSGRAPSGPQEVVLGPKLLDELGKRLGDPVEVVGPTGASIELTVVGTALSPLSESRSFNAEAFYSSEVDDAVKPENMKEGAFELAQVRFAEGVDKAAAAERIDRDYPFALMNESYARPPAEIANLAQLATLPRALAAFLSFVGMAALVHALVVSVRSRRRDVGILRSLGFTRAQTATLIVSMTTTIVGVGVIVGVPLGLVVGTSGWRLVAQRVYVAPDGVMPYVLVVVAAAVAVGIANVIAVLPARAASRQAPIEALRAE